MTQAWAAGIGALILIVAPVGASLQTGLTVNRHHDGGGSIGVACGGRCLRFRQGHNSFRSESKLGGNAANITHNTKRMTASPFFAVIRCETNVGVTPESGRGARATFVVSRSQRSYCPR